MRGYFFFASALIALAFLVYSMVSQQPLEIKLYHPRVVLEFVSFLSFMSLAIYFLIKK